MSIVERLRDKANSLPASPGVYIMKNADGEIIYVGKSKKLKARVTSYFTGTHHTPKTAKMVSLVRDFDYIVCKTEIEALTLENVLIKRHSPKYNIKLKDAKSYPYIKVSSEEYPRLFVTRDRGGERGRCFGPYQSADAAHTALEAVMRIFSLATCRRRFPKDIGKERPCIYLDMGRCIAPCTGKVSAEEYKSLVKCAEGVLAGNTKEIKNELQSEMEAASEKMEFERAAALRDSIRALEKLSDKQKVVADERVMRDCFALHITDCEGVLALLSVRGGALVNKNEFILSSFELAGPEEALSLIVDYYDTAGVPPKEVMLGFSLDEENRRLLGEYLSLLAPYKVTVKTPERGEGRALCDMALENAKEMARQSRLEVERENKSVLRLAELLGLAERPHRIEAYDISNIGNENITASMVVYKNGALKKSDYRFFTIKSTEGADDYASMREALKRRLSHIGDGSLSFGEVPDLLLIDGGEAHVRTVKAVLREMQLDINTFGMVKDEYHKTRALTDGYSEISIAREMGVYTFIYNLQEEAHRFAVKNSMGAKRRSLTHSTLERISGIGPKKARLLLAAMPISKIKEADIPVLEKIKGISKADAKAIYDYYRSEGAGKERRK